MTSKLNFVGDVWVGDGTSSPSGLPVSIREGAVINLEGPISRRGAPLEDKICLASDPDQFTRIFPVAPVAACLANNHIMDFGEQAFSDTLAYLEDRGIRYYGAGKLADRCNNPLLLSIGGTVVALTGYVCPSTHATFAVGNSSGVPRIALSTIRQDVAIARAAGAERVVVTLHWGSEEVRLPKPEDLVTARRLLELGVDLVVGHHAHRRQPVYIHRQQLVFFGLGNAVFPDFEYRVGGAIKAWGRQRWWNNTGLAVTYLPSQGVATWQSFNQSSSRFARLAVKTFPVARWTELPLGATNAYRKRYLNAVRRAYARLAISRFVARPRWPSPASLSAVLGHVLRGR